MAIRNQQIDPGDRVRVTLTNRFDRKEEFTATVIGWNPSGTLKVLNDQAGLRPQRNVSADNVRLISKKPST